MADRTALINDIRLRYTVEGQGPDVVLIHGWVASRRMWTQLVERLSESYRCWALDLPGCGDSDKPDESWYSIPRYSDVIRSFMDAHGLPRAHVVGHSMGGMISFDLAATYPQLVDRLVTINPVVTGRATISPLAAAPWSRRLLGWSLRLSPALISPVLRHPLGEKLHPAVGFIRRRNEDFEKGTVESIWGSGRAVVRHSVAPSLARITADTLVILGERDTVVPNTEGRLAAERIPGARRVILPTGHLPTDERPAETLGLLRDFLAPGYAH